MKQKDKSAEYLQHEGRGPFQIQISKNHMILVHSRRVIQGLKKKKNKKYLVNISLIKPSIRKTSMINKYF